MKVFFWTLCGFYLGCILQHSSEQNNIKEKIIYRDVIKQVECPHETEQEKYDRKVKETPLTDF